MLRSDSTGVDRSRWFDPSFSQDQVCLKCRKAPGDIVIYRQEVLAASLLGCLRGISGVKQCLEDLPATCTFLSLFS